MQIARRQRGLFTREQAGREAGLSRGWIARRVASRAWVPVLRGVYRVEGTPGSWEQRLVAACLWAGDGAVISHRTAATLHKLEGIRPVRRIDPIELTVPEERQRHAPGLVVHRSRALARSDRTTIDEIPVTSLPRTLIDLSSDLDERRLTVAIDSGLARHRFVDVRWLRRELDRLKVKGREIAPFFERLLEERSPDAVHLDSALERRFSAALRAARLLRPVEHYEVVEDGRRLGELDFAYPRLKLGIELDGAAVHGQKRVFERDREQLSELATSGWSIVHVTWAQLDENENAVLERLGRAIAKRGG
jgi:very-short-patch-repair endonuclease